MRHGPGEIADTPSTFDPTLRAGHISICPRRSSGPRRARLTRPKHRRSSSPATPTTRLLRRSRGGRPEWATDGSWPEPTTLGICGIGWGCPRLASLPKIDAGAGAGTPLTVVSVPAGGDRCECLPLRLVGGDLAHRDDHGSRQAKPAAV